MSGFSLDAVVKRMDLNRIVKKLGTVQKTLTGNDSILVKFVIREVLDDYRQAIVSAMGVVSSDGGTVTPESFMGLSRSITWEPLAQVTVDKKMTKGWHTEIWAATGAAKDAVKIHSTHTANTHKLFVGLQPSDGAAYKHAWKTEVGEVSTGRGTPRALFTVMNDLFRYNTPIIVEKLQQLIVREAKWGNG